MPGIWHHGCCCGCPCMGDQPNVTVTTSGTCDSYCQQLEGEYVFGLNYSGDGYCFYRWHQSGGQGELYMVYCKETDEWWGRIVGFISNWHCADFGVVADSQEPPCYPLSPIKYALLETSLTCEEGVWTGEIDLPGSDELDPGCISDCSGCVAHATFG